jgi:serine/threonine-protein kinase
MENNQLSDRYIGLVLDGRYEIIERIGTGGMALVYKGRDSKLERHVAIKILKDDLADDSEFRDRFQNESKAVAMLSHANIVSVYDTSKSGTSPDYIVMELIEGISLKQYMDNRGEPLSWKEALHFTMQIAKALAHAHSRGVIHRDIKPHNIMLVHDSSVKVTDFGIARFTATSRSLTKDTMGSVHYISPEQARGSEIDKRTDIYSLGVVLYEILTGRLPFEAETSIATAIQHFTSTPLAPRDINPEIPKGLEAIVMRMMNPDLSKRYPSAEVLMEDLETFRRQPETEFDYVTFTSPELEAELNANGDEPMTNNSKRNGVNKTRGRTGRKDFDYTAEAKKARRNAWLTGLFLIIVALIGLSIFLWNYIFKDMFSDSITIVVPDWTNLMYEDIYNDPQYNGYFTFSRKEEDSDEILPGHVISQSPPAERTKVRTNKEIEVVLTVSVGPKTITLRDYHNVDYRAATSELRQLGLIVAEPIFELSDSVTDSYVIRTAPDADTIRHPGDTVTLYVSKGAQIKFKTVPNVVGRALIDAQGIIENQNLTVGDIKTAESEEPYGTVLEQSISQNEEVEEHTRINLTISDGTLGENAGTPNPDLPDDPEIDPDVTPPPYDPDDYYDPEGLGTAQPAATYSPTATPPAGSEVSGASPSPGGTSPADTAEPGADAQPPVVVSPEGDPLI